MSNFTCTLCQGEVQYMHGVYIHAKPLIGCPGPLVPVCGLTPRQYQVVLGIGRGLTYSEIGSSLGIRPRTAHNHVFNGVRRIGARNILHIVGLVAADHALKTR